MTQIFETHNSLNNLEKFISQNGALHYKLPFNKNKITLIKKDEPLKFPELININNEEIVIFQPDFNVYWHLYE